MDILTSLLTERDNVLAEARKINETAARFQRDLSSGEQTRWDAIMARIPELDQRITEVSDLEERNAKADEVRAQLRGHAPATSTAKADPAIDAFRSAVLERNPAPIEVRDDSPSFVRYLGAERRDLLTTRRPTSGPSASTTRS